MKEIKDVRHHRDLTLSELTDMVKGIK